MSPTEAHLEIVARDLGTAAAKHFELVLRIGEALEPTLTNGVEHHDPGATLGRLAQVAEHARMIRARVLAEHENGVRLLEVVELHGALAYADALAQGHATGFVAHVRTVGEIIRAVESHEQLIQERRFVAGAAGGVELRAIGAVEATQERADLREGFRPIHREIAVAQRIVAKRLGQAALLLEVVIRPGTQRGNCVPCEEIRGGALVSRLPRHRLHAVLAELER